jgi:outer membrane receptor protein involved in Fe transport
MIVLLLAAMAQATPDIVVTGRALESDAGEEGTNSVVIDRKQLLERANRGLDNILGDVGDVQGFRRSDARSTHPTSQSITMRGLGGNAASRSLLILDGVPQADPFGGWVAFPAYAVDRLNSVRVTRGGGSALWGNGALAGTVELESATPDQLRPIEGRLAVGSRGSFDGLASLTGKSLEGFVTGSLALTRGDGFVPMAREDRGPIDRRAPYRQISAFIRGVTEVAPATELQANLLLLGDRRTRGVPNTGNKASGTDGSVRLVGRGPVGWSLLGYVQHRRLESEFASIDAARTTSTLVLDQYKVPARGWGARGELSFDLGAVDLRTGADLRIVSGETNELFQFVAGSPTKRRVAGGRNTTAGLFAAATTEVGKLRLSAAGRIDRWAIRDGRLDEISLIGGTDSATRFAGRSRWEPTGRLGLTWEVSSKLNVRAAAYRGWRLPTLNELYRPFRAGADATAANAALDPETMVGAEAGTDWRPSSDMKLSLTAFVARLDDAIANVTIAQGPGVFPGVGFVSAAGSFRRRENLDSVTSRGIEAEWEGTFGAVSASLSYAFVDARVRDDGVGSAVDGLRPVQVPKHHLALAADWNPSDATSIGALAKWASARFEDDANERRLAGAPTVDAYATQRFGRRWKFGLRAENLFDRRVEASVSERGEVERATPRTIWLELGFVY